HDLVALSQKNLTLRISKPINKVPEKYIPKKLAITVRLPETKGALQCTTSRGTGPQAGAIFFAVAFLLQYDPLNKFLLVRSADLDASLRFPLSPFKLINARTDFPQLCVGVQATESNDKYEFNWVKFEDRKVLNTSDTLDISLFNNAKLDVVGMSQIGKDSLLFAYRNKVVITDLEGREKTKLAVFTFNFHIEHIHTMPDSILAFHSHGVQGRCLSNNTVTQDISDMSKIYRVIGND
ncbi:CNH domain protein, partial [Ancylostoma duodenale]